MNSLDKTMELRKENTQKLKTQMFIKRAVVIIILLIIIFHCITIYFDSPNLIKLYKNIYKDIIRVVLVSMSIWCMLEDTFRNEYKCEKGVCILHFLLGFLSCTSIVSLYFLHRNNSSIYHLMEDLWGDLFGYRVSQIYLCFLGLTALVSIYALFSAHKTSKSYYGVVCHGIGAMRTIFLIEYLFLQLSWYQEYENFIQWIVYSILVYLTGIVFAMCYRRLKST